MIKDNKRTILSLYVGAGALLLITCFTPTLFVSVRPTDATVLSYRHEVDLSSLQPGAMLKVQWEGLEVLVLRRTTDQIRWLERYEAPASQGTVGRDPIPHQINNRFRSIKREYLVVSAARDAESLYLREIASYHSCEDFRFDARPLKVEAAMHWPASFYCAKSYGHEIDDLSRTMFVYDLAGRNKNRWFAPLEIPPHYFRNGNVLVLDRSAFL